MLVCMVRLRWLETVFSSFLDLMGHYYHYISVYAESMVSKNCSIIDEYRCGQFVA